MVTLPPRAAEEAIGAVATASAALSHATRGIEVCVHVGPHRRHRRCGRVEG